MSYSKHKDLPPEETLKKIKDAFSFLGIELKHIINKRMDGIYSCIVYDPKNWWTTAGKGTSEEYCLASGYAEAMEHLCSYCAYSCNLADQIGGNFKRYPDEKICSVREAIQINEDVYADVIDSFTNDGSLFNLKECENVWTEVLGMQNATLVPYFNMKNNDVTYLPEEIIGRLCGSTGGGAGNSPCEAISHAFDEVCERYVKYIIYFYELTPPTIPINFIKENCEEIYNVIMHIESLGYKIIVKDASLGKNFPVVAVAIINPNEKSYMIKFGAHCCFNIALERCFTEMFQFYSLDSNGGNGHKKFHIWSEFDDINSKTESNWFSQLKDDTGAVPIKFFYSKESWNFNPWGINIDYNNEIGVKFHIDNFKRQGIEKIYIRDISFLGFPVFKVYIPKISVSHFSINSKIIEEFIVCSKIIEDIRNNNDIEIKKYHNILLNAFSKSSYVGSMILKNVNEELIDICYAAIYYEKNNDYSILKQMSITNKYASAILMNFKLENDGLSLNERELFFKMIVDVDVFEIVECWMKENIFIEMIHCFKRITKTESDNIKWEDYDIDSVNQTHMKFKKAIAKNIPNQMNLLQHIIRNL